MAEIGFFIDVVHLAYLLNDETDDDDVDVPEDNGIVLSTTNILQNERDTVELLVMIADLIEVIKDTDDQDLSNSPRRKKRRWGVHPLNQMRKEKGHSQNLYVEMRLNDTETFFNFTRMNTSQFDDLLNLIGPAIAKHSSNALQPHERLLITLRFLASGDSLTSLHYNFRIGITTAHIVVTEVCNALWTHLMPIFLPFPSTSKWVNISAGFNKLGFPNCIGAIDGKHVAIQAPNKSGTMFYNYLKHFSIVLLAVCDAQKNFVYVDIGAYGGQSDGGVLFNLTLGKKMDDGSLNMPEPKALPGTNESFPFFIIGDEAFPLRECLQRPYSGRNLPPIKFQYNKKHSSVRKVIENAFGILVQRWRIFHKTLIAEASNVDKIIKATVVLHNFIKSYNDNARYATVSEDEPIPPGSILQNISVAGLRFGSNNASNEAYNLRDKYANYLLSRNQQT